MSTNVKKLLLFTLTACPTGRSMGQVLAELKKLHPELVTETYYTEIHIEETNHYRIKQNPTLLFLSKDGMELSRLEGFHETEAIDKQLTLLEQAQVELGSKQPENMATLEKYTIYLFKQDRLVPLEVEHRNPTGVKAPRITAIQLQLETSKPGLVNPFPVGTSLELVQFEGPKGTIYLQADMPIKSTQLEQMKQTLLNTLEPYGIQEIEVYVN